MAMTIYVDEQATTPTETITLEVEELEEVIAPGRRINHNETLVREAEEIELDVEELEEVIAPGRRANHNETLVRDAEEIELDVEELEEVIAPVKYPNHNETLVATRSEAQPVRFVIGNQACGRLSDLTRSRWRLLPVHPLRPLMNEQLEGLISMIPAEQLKRLHSLSRQVEVCCAQGQYQKAESLYRHALSRAEMTCGAEHIEVSTILNNLAVVYKYLGRFAEAG